MYYDIRLPGICHSEHIYTENNISPHSFYYTIAILGAFHEYHWNAIVSFNLIYPVKFMDNIRIMNRGRTEQLYVISVILKE